MRVSAPIAPKILRSPSLAWGVAFALVGALMYPVARTVGRFDLPLPIVALAPVFLWGLTRPGVAAVVAVFVVGLLHDMIMDAPLGVWTFGFLAAYAAGAAQRNALAGQSGPAVWISFALTALVFAAASSLAWFIARGLVAPDFARLFADVSVTVALGPLLGAVFGGFSQAAQLAGDPT